MALLTVRGPGMTIGTLAPLDDVSFEARKGEILGLVGESGASKSLTAMAVMDLLGRMGGGRQLGSILFDGKELVGLRDSSYRRLRGKRISLISQNS
ncbi:ATP-binding cassette domain-containing protein [Roseinatronobacter monicus]|uniref:ATP-binding cassette domain-containing protein n=1 Tax=Roseinatronobacter monicus TaxID=393481 RepID=UPI0014772D11|nr:ATP-binding cassette domain-containing protein [Roseinatronobacter monicus]